LIAMENSAWQKTLDRVGKETHRNSFPSSEEVTRFVWESLPKEGDVQQLIEMNDQGEIIIRSPDMGSYPPGFSRDTADIALPSTPEENETALPVFLNLEKNFISENSLHSIVRNAQDTDTGFRQDQAPPSPSPVLFTPAEGLGNDEHDGTNNIGWNDSYFLPPVFRGGVAEPVETIEPQKNWDNAFLNEARGHNEGMANHFFGNTSPPGNKHDIFGNKSLDNDLGFLDMSADFDAASKGSNSFNTSNGSGIWDSPTRGGMNNGNMHQLPTQSTMASRLTARECVQLIQSLGNSLSECKDTDSFHASQILGLMQLIQGQLMAGIQSPVCSQSPTTPRHHSSSSSSDSTVERAAKYHERSQILLMLYLLGAASYPSVCTGTQHTLARFSWVVSRSILLRTH